LAAHYTSKMISQLFHKKSVKRWY